MMKCHKTVLILLMVIVLIILFSVYSMRSLREGHGVVHGHDGYYGRSGSTKRLPWYPYWYSPEEEEHYYYLQYPFDYKVAQ